MEFHEWREDMNIMKRFVFKCNDLERRDWWDAGVGRNDNIAAFVYLALPTLYPVQARIGWPVLAGPAQGCFSMASWLSLSGLSGGFGWRRPHFLNGAQRNIERLQAPARWRL
jgi:hypothetical protein